MRPKVAYGLCYMYLKHELIFDYHLIVESFLVARADPGLLKTGGAKTTVKEAIFLHVFAFLIHNFSIFILSKNRPVKNRVSQPPVKKRGGGGYNIKET